MNKVHNWRSVDDLAAMYLYRCPRGALSLADLAAATGIDPGAMGMRVRNFKALETGTGLTNVSSKSKRVLKEFGTLSCDQIEVALRERLAL